MGRFQTLGRGWWSAVRFMPGGFIALVEPAGVGEVVVGDAFDLSGDEVRRDILDLAGGYAAIDGAGFYFHAFEDDGSGSDDGIFSDFRVIHNDRAHADEHAFLNSATVHYGVMTDGYVVADGDPGFFIGTMDDDAILDIHLVADADAVDIAADDGIEPDAAVIAHLHVSHDGSVRRDKTIFSKARGFAFYR